MKVGSFIALKQNILEKQNVFIEMIYIIGNQGYNGLENS